MKSARTIHSLENVFLETKDHILFLNNRDDPVHSRGLFFYNPQGAISCSEAQEMGRAFGSMEKALKAGYFVAGFLSYEAGACFEEVLLGERQLDFPLLWFGIFEEPAEFEFERTRMRESGFWEKVRGGYRIDDLKPAISRELYVKDIARIKEYISQGETYQVNYTFKYRFSFAGSAYALFCDLSTKQRVSYSALLRCGDLSILSLSPELFFERTGNEIIVKPMKGTMARGRFGLEDERMRGALAQDTKNRAENVMIVDLLRNDLGRICEYGSVCVERLFEVERYETLFQMVSTVKGTLKPSVRWYEIFKSIFPSGSVTGAPKIRTMRIIAELEREPRRIYTGSIGYISPQRRALFNVAIRTILVDSRSSCGEMGVGSGIVWDSDAEREYAECELKARFLTSEVEDFQLIETLLWRSDGGYVLFDEHVERLQRSARYFGFRYDGERIRTRLNEFVSFFRARQYRVRLLLYKDGNVELASSEMGAVEMKELPWVSLSSKRTDSQNPHLYHKTTRRAIYDDEYARVKEKGLVDIIFLNEKGEVTEAATSNIFIKKDGVLYTPPIECGLLDGVYRQYLIRSSQCPIKEKVLYKEDLLRADAIYLTNSVRGLREVQFSDGSLTGIFNNASVDKVS